MHSLTQQKFPTLKLSTCGKHVSGLLFTGWYLKCWQHSCGIINWMNSPSRNQLKSGLKMTSSCNLLQSPQVTFQRPALSCAAICSLNYPQRHIRAACKHPECPSRTTWITCPLPVPSFCTAMKFVAILSPNFVTGGNKPRSANIGRNEIFGRVYDTFLIFDKRGNVHIWDNVKVYARLSWLQRSNVWHDQPVAHVQNRHQTNLLHDPFATSTAASGTGSSLRSTSSPDAATSPAT